jgi:hypothetical protein
MQNNLCWSLKNADLTNEVPLHPVKVGVWCAVSTRMIVVPVFLTKQLIAKISACRGTAFSTPTVICDL